MKKYESELDEKLIKNAYTFAITKHGTQMRDSGDPFICHPLEVAEILISMKMDQDTVIAGILHDTIEDTDTTTDDIVEQFGSDVANIVNGVTKLSKFSELSLYEEQQENFKKMLIAAASDIRVLVIKLADRLHNMRTLHFKNSKSKRHIIAKETLDIYAPLAERIGISKVKDELQEISFRELYPDVYNSLNTRIDQYFVSSRETILNIKNTLYDLLLKADIECTINGRLKTSHSIWEKLNTRSISFEQLSDIMAFRIIVNDVSSCYKALGIIHRSYLVIPGRFRDYISTPKNNNYKSLHTSIIGPFGKRIEVQVRTHEMHMSAEYGIAAHWDYKTKDKAKNKNEYQWLNNLASIINSNTKISDFLKKSKHKISINKVFGLTPKGKIFELPIGSTVLDFAYAIHTDIGNHAETILMNGNAVPFNTKLENGNQIEVVTSKSIFPGPDWEQYVYTNRAKLAIRKALHGTEKERLIFIGRSNFDDFLMSQSIEKTKDLTIKIANMFNFNTENRLFEAIGSSEVTVNNLKNTCNNIININPRNNNINISNNISSYSFITGLPNMPIIQVSCCMPVPGDKLIGIVYDNGIEIHIDECHTEYIHQNTTYKRITSLCWDQKAFLEGMKYKTKLSAIIGQQQGNLSKIANIVEEQDSKITNLKIGKPANGQVSIGLELEVFNISHLALIISSLNNNELIYDVKR